MIRLYNHQVEAVGMNQILSTFMPERSPELRYFQQIVGIDETADGTVAALAHNCAISIKINNNG
jgi:hypothetical protein